MWLGLLLYFGLLGLRVAFDYVSLRRYLKLPLIERPAPADKVPSTAVVTLPDGTAETDVDWLLFVPIGATYQPQAPELMVRFAIQHTTPAVSIILQERCVSPWEQLLLPFVTQQCFLSRRYAQVSPGHALLVDRASYDELADAIKPNSVESLTAAIQAKGMRPLVARAERLAEVRSYTTTDQLRAGARRRLRAGGLPALLGMGLSILALPCAVYGLATSSLPFELAALITWLTSATEMALWQLIFRAPFRWAFLQPLAAVLAWIILLSRGD